MKASRWSCLLVLAGIATVAAAQANSQIDVKGIAANLETRIQACPRRELVQAFPRRFHKQIWQKAAWGPPTEVLADAQPNDSILYPFRITVEYYLSINYGPERQTKAEAESDSDLKPLNVPLPSVRGSKYRSIFLVGSDGIRLKATEYLQSNFDGTPVGWVERPQWPDACWDQIK